MKQDDVVAKVSAELIASEVVDRQHRKLLEQHLMWVYAAGFDWGRRKHSNFKSVIKFDMAGNRIAEYDSVIDAARQNNLTKHSISKNALGKTSNAGGYIWRYKDE